MEGIIFCHTEKLYIFSAELISRIITKKGKVMANFLNKVQRVNSCKFEYQRAQLAKKR